MQGPPGTGKTYTAAEQILELIAEGRTVGITGPSHAVICHLIDTVYEHARWRGAGTPRIGQRADRDHPHLHADATMMSNEQLERALRDGELDVAAGTSWLWARAGMTGSVDTLFVDEAGQLSLANVLAVAGGGAEPDPARRPQQLAQPSHATHPPGAGGLLRREAARVGGLGAPGERGLRIGAAHRRGAAPGQHERLAGRSQRGVAANGQLTGRTWRDKDGTERPVGPGRHLDRDALQRADQGDRERAGHQPPDRVGTVDKFQGLEAPVVIFSMATSSADEAPRGLEFLYELHRLNVAISRARALAIIVASPDLIRVSCRAPHQMVLANALFAAPGTERRNGRSRPDQLMKQHDMGHLLIIPAMLRAA